LRLWWTRKGGQSQQKQQCSAPWKATLLLDQIGELMSQWPKGVHLKHGALYLVRAVQKKKKWCYLCRIDEVDQQGTHVLWTALARHSQSTPRTLRELAPLFIAQATTELRAPTVHAYHRVLIGPPTEPHKMGIINFRFGHMMPDDLEPQDVAYFLDQRKKEGRGRSGNRERAALSSFYEWMLRNKVATRNPCRGIRRNKETPSKVYVAHDQLRNTYERAAPALQLLINGAYLSGMRLTDIMNLRRDQVTSDGIQFTESKTGKRNLIEWAPGLSEIVRRAIEYGDAVATKITKKLRIIRPIPVYVFVNSRAQRWTQYAVSSAMRRADADFAIRQLRAKAETDSRMRDDKRASVLGHEGQMRETYTRHRRLKAVG
jgi:integrase